MEYLLLPAAIALFALAYRNHVTYKKVKYTGKIPVIMLAKQNTTLYMLLGGTAFFLFISVLLMEYL